MAKHHRLTSRSRAAKDASCVLELTVVRLALLLSACGIDGTSEFQADGSMHPEMVFKDTKGMMAKIGRSCSNLKSYVSSLHDFLAKAIYEETISEKGAHKCKVVSDEPLNNVEVKKEGDNNLLIIGKQGTGGKLYVMKVTIRIGVPGKTIKTTNGVIKGNKVVIDDFNRIMRGITITRTSDVDAPHGSLSSDSASGSVGGKTTAGSSAGDSGLSVWGWIGSGVNILVLALILGVLTGRCKGRTAPPSLNLGQRQSTTVSAAVEPELTHDEAADTVSD